MIVTFPFLVFLFASSVTYAILICIFHHYVIVPIKRRKLRLPPGSMGFPLVGETLQLISAFKTENPETFIDEKVNRYGKVFTTHLFGEATIFSTDPEVNKYVLMNEGKLFESSYPSSISTLLGKNSLVLMKGSFHKRMHSLTTALSNPTLIRQHFFVDMDRLVRSNLKAWPKQISLLTEAKKITFELTMKQLMSIDPGEWTVKMMIEYLHMIDGFFSLPIPLFFTTYGRAIKGRKKVIEMVGTLVKRRKEKRGNEKDMLETLLEAEEGLSDEQVTEFLVALLVGGYETTSTLMTLSVKFLTENHSALSQLREEHDEIRKRKKPGESLDWNDYKSMVFTQCVINETLRMSNIVGGVLRRATSDVHIKGYFIPKGWKVFTSFTGIHLDRDLYLDARTFNPWRWQKNASSSNQTANIFTPFGGGARYCPGYELARVEASVFLHYLVTNFYWTPTEDDQLLFFPTTRTVKGYPILVECRKSI